MIYLRFSSIFIFLCLAAFGAHAQKSQIIIAQNSLGKLQASISAKEDHKKQITIIGEGIKALDAAQKDKRTRHWPMTWAMKGYLASYLAVIDNNESNADRYFDQAVKAIDTAKLLDKYQTNSDLINAGIQNIYVKKQAEGNKAYQQNDFLTAFRILREVSDYLPADTSIALNVAICAQHIQEHDDALTYFLRAKNSGVKNPLVFQYIAQLYTSKFENELAIKALEEGLALNPSHPFLTNDYLNLLLDNEKYDKAVKVLSQSNMPATNHSKLVYYLTAYLQQSHLKNYKLAEDNYRKALAMDQNYFDALYQLALIYIHQSNESLKHKNAAQYQSLLNRAEFTLLRAYEMNTNDSNTIQLLIEIYERKHRYDRVQELRRRLREF